MRIFLVPLVLLFLALPARAQTPAAPGQEQLVDRVVAVVGDTILLFSDVQGELSQLQAAGQLPTEAAQIELIARQIIETRVSDLLLLTAAREAGLTPPEEQVLSQVEVRLREVQGRFPSPAAFEAALRESGISMDMYRRDLAQQIRDEFLSQQFIAQALQNRSRPVIDEAEIQEFWETQRTTLPQRPATLSFRQVVVAPEPTDSARQAALTEAQQVLQELQNGGDFEVLARRFSDDAGTAEHGGDLGWFGTGRMVPEFEQVAFALRAGQTSGIVETEFGFHIIKVERTRTAERQARHILIQPEITEADVARARASADSVMQAVRAGTPLGTLSSRYNRDDDLPVVTRYPLDRLPPEYSTLLSPDSATVENLYGPMRLENPRGDRWAVIQVTERLTAGDYTLDDLRDQVREQLEQRKMIETVLQELRDRIYVNVRV